MLTPLLGFVGFLIVLAIGSVLAREETVEQDEEVLPR
jgi:hypothetical protein